MIKFRLNLFNIYYKLNYFIIKECLKYLELISINNFQVLVTYLGYLVKKMSPSKKEIPYLILNLKKLIFLKNVRYVKQLNIFWVGKLS